MGYLLHQFLSKARSSVGLIPALRRATENRFNAAEKHPVRAPARLIFSRLSHSGKYVVRRLRLDRLWSGTGAEAYSDATMR